MYPCCKICGGILHESALLSYCGYLFHTECLKCFHAKSSKSCAGCGTRSEGNGSERPECTTYTIVWLRRAAIDRDNEDHQLLRTIFAEVLELERTWRRNVFIPELSAFLPVYYDAG